MDDALLGEPARQPAGDEAPLGGNQHGRLAVGVRPRHRGSPGLAELNSAGAAEPVVVERGRPGEASGRVLRTKLAPDQTFAGALLAQGLGEEDVKGVIAALTQRFLDEMRSRHPDGTLRDAKLHGLKTCPNIAVVRFDGSLYFGNAGYFEDKILEVVASKPDLSYIIIDGEGINQLDSTGEEVLHHLAERLENNGIHILVARMKKQFMDVIRSTRLIEKMGEEHFFSRIQYALDYAWDSLGEDYDRTNCPLRMR